MTRTSPFSNQPSTFRTCTFHYVSLFVVLDDELVLEDDVSGFVLDSDFSPLSVFFSPADPEEPDEPLSVEDFFA